MMQRTASVLSIVIFAAITAVSQISPATVIDRSLEAIGPSRDRDNVRSINAIADCTGPNGKYTTEIDSANGFRLVFRQFRPNGNNYIGTQNGLTSWTSRADGDFDLADRKETFVWRAHDYQRIALEIGTRFHDFKYGGESEFGGVPAVRLDSKDELGNDAAVFFSRSSGLLIGFTVRNPFSGTAETIRTVFSEWKKVGTLTLPAVATATDKTGDFVLRFREIKLNQNRDETFAVPPKVASMLEILAVHNSARAAHFNREAKLLVSTFADEFADVRNGAVERPDREKSLGRFESYFRNSTFIEWDDVEPPVIRVSDDSTLAYTIVRKRVRLKTRNSAGAEVEETDVFSWIATYKKIRGVWKLTAIASTRAPK